MIEKLYGVNHGGVANLGREPVGEIVVYPSVGLHSELMVLPPGTKVGIETLPELFSPNAAREAFKINGRSFKVDKSSESYWKEIIRICMGYDLEIIFLDDLSILREEAAKTMEAVDYKKTRNRYLKQQNKMGRPVSENKLRELNEAIYKAQTEAEWIHVVEREEKLVTNILQRQPQIVIIGMGHGDYLMLKQELLEARGLKVNRYKREEINHEPISLFDFFAKGQSYKVRSRLSDSQPDEAFILERELLQRRHNAATQWRILPKLTPDFIGSWNIGCRPEGLFELYAIPTGFMIEDCLGTAFFSGEIDEQRVSFSKKYDVGHCSKEADPGLIFYHGGFHNGCWEGTWRAREVKDKFVLYKGKEFIR